MEIIEALFLKAQCRGPGTKSGGEFTLQITGERKPSTQERLRGVKMTENIHTRITASGSF